MRLRRYPAPATPRPWWRTVGSAARCAIHIEHLDRTVRAMSNPTFRECPPSATPHSQNRDDWPVRLLGAWRRGGFVPPPPAASQPRCSPSSPARSVSRRFPRQKSHRIIAPPSHAGLTPDASRGRSLFSGASTSTAPPPVAFYPPR